MADPRDIPPTPSSAPVHDPMRYQPILLGEMERASEANFARALELFADLDEEVPASCCDGEACDACQ